MYTVYFIDGHDLYYKTYRVEASSEDEAIQKTIDAFGDNFEHRITGVKKD